MEKPQLLPGGRSPANALIACTLSRRPGSGRGGRSSLLQKSKGPYGSTRPYGIQLDSVFRGRPSSTFLAGDSTCIQNFESTCMPYGLSPIPLGIDRRADSMCIQISNLLVCHMVSVRFHVESARRSIPSGIGPRPYGILKVELGRPRKTESSWMPYGLVLPYGFLLFWKTPRRHHQTHGPEIRALSG